MRKVDLNLNLNSLLVKRQIDNPSPGEDSCMTGHLQYVFSLLILNASDCILEWLNTPAASVKNHVSGQEVSVQRLVQTATDGSTKTV